MKTRQRMKFTPQVAWSSPAIRALALAVSAAALPLAACDVAGGDSGEAQLAEPAGGDAVVGAGLPPRCPGYNANKNVYFGDLHDHTSFSLDAWTFGTRVDPAQAYAFARRQTSVWLDGADGTGGGPWTTIDRPLDFVAMTDHSEFLDPDDRLQPEPWPSNPWRAEQDITAAANDPCRFTAFNAYEWTYVDPSTGANHHHNVIFADEHVTPTTIDARNYPGMLTLWQTLDTVCAGAGCTALTIPHNSNQSQGTAFSFTNDMIPYMVRYQPLVEIYQHKGNSECMSDPSDGDPYCSFEQVSDNANPDDAPGYVRSGLKTGIATYQGTHTNPLKLGFVGATDNHAGTPGNVKEDQWPGYLSGNDNTPLKRVMRFPEFSPGAITAVWAEENTRPSIFSALSRRETYATSGPRMTVRFHQYWGPIDPCADPSYPARLVAAGATTMGGTMSGPPAASMKPRFVVNATPDETPLDRIDIIKLVWDPAQNKAVEHVIRLDTSRGFCATWRDDDYDPSLTTAYYARVFQQETWRWSHYDCAQLSPKPLRCTAAGDLDRRIRERAWTSPIFYEP